MKHIILATTLGLAPVILAAQSQEETDKGYLTSLIEGSLSGASRDVSILGFEGALSSAASLDVMTIADSEGVWLTLEDVILDWNRSALLRGRIEVETLSAARIIVARPPITESSGPAPEATPFSLPDLPVSLELGALDIQNITLGEAFLGEEISLSLQGSAALSGGEGDVDVTATRIGAQTGIFAINGAYSNETRILDLNLNVAEGADGIAATLLDLPDRPSTALRIAGTAPIDNYAATLALDTNGVERIEGDFALTADDAGQIISLDINGDVTPLFDPAYQDFFGDDVALIVKARTATTGQVDLEDLDLRAKSLQLRGTAKIDAKGWPQNLNLRGQIANDTGEAVLLPLAGPKTFVDRASFNLGFDTDISPDWSTELSLAGFDRPGISMRNLTLDGGGILIPGEGDARGEVTANLRYAAQGLELDDAGAAEALGNEISGVFEAARTEGSPTNVTRLTLDGPGIELLADATVSGASNGLRTQSNILLTVRQLGRFSTLAGRALAGSGDLAIASTIVPLDGKFDVIVTGTTQDLSLGIAQLDNVLAGTGDIAAAAVRDADGTRLETLRIATPAVDLTANADLTSNGSRADFRLLTDDISRIEPKLSGAADITGDLIQDATGKITVQVNGTAPATAITANAEINPTPTGQTVNFDVNADLDDLARYAALTGQRISGGAQANLSGVLLGDMARFDVDLTAQTNNLALGIAQLDPLLRGQGTLSADLTRTGIDRFRLNALDLRTDAIAITGNADGGLDGQATAMLRADIPDATRLGQGLSGPVTATLDASRDANNQAKVDLRVDGPGTDIDLRADVDPALAIDGVLTADVANIATYRSLIGQPVSGSISARIAGGLVPDLSAFNADIDVKTNGLGIGNPTVDPLLAGAGRLVANATLANGGLSVRNLSASTSELSLSGNLDGRGSAGRGDFTARLRDVGIFTDQLSGAVTANGTASLDAGGNWGVRANADGPGGITVRADGTVGRNGRLDIDIDGQAPLGLANRAIEPRRISGDAIFDLALNGAPALDAVSGRIALQNARLTAPTLSQGLSDITGGVTLRDGRAIVDVSGNVQSGGGLRVTGPVTLNAPQTADIAIDLNDVIIKDPELYRTSVNGQITVKGPVQGGARIAGQLNLGQTDVQVPSSGVGALGSLPNVTHIGASAQVRQTLNRAGLTATPAAPKPNTNSAAAFPLDVTINAPSRIFIRGRGVDAELGGSLKIGGTTANIQPVGLFELVRGRIDILQQRFELTEGSASLQGDFEPFIRLVATTQARTGTVISIIVEGPATAPEVSFVSTPSLPQDEVLSQLIFGRDLQNISPLQAVQLAAAVGTLAGSGGGGLIDNFRQDIGLDDFDITTDDDGNAAVRAGKYLTENVYTDVTVASDGSTEINLNLDITDDITAKGSVDADGETSIGIFFERDY